MKITLFTSNQLRHKYFINLLSIISDDLFVIQENRALKQSIIPDFYPKTKVMKKYFSMVLNAEEKIFRNTNISDKKIKIFPLQIGDLNKYSIKNFKDCLKSDIYIIFGSSYIKGELIDFLIKNRAISIHMGVSPYYRGSDCNFWALYDGNTNLVGSTVHLISKKIDEGSILYHSLSEMISDPFLYTMSSVKSVFYSLIKKINDKSIFSIQDKFQDRSKEIRYSRKKEFTDEIVKKFLIKKINLKKEFNLSDFKEPFILRKDNILQK